MRLKLLKNRLYVSDERFIWTNHLVIFSVIFAAVFFLSLVLIYFDYEWASSIANATLLTVNISFYVFMIYRALFANKMIVTKSNLHFTTTAGKLICERSMITQYWFEGQKLFIQRVNRVDELDYSNVRKQDFEKMLAKLDELDLSYTTAPPEIA